MYIHIYTYIYIYIYICCRGHRALESVALALGEPWRELSTRAALRATDPSLRTLLALGGAPTSCCPRNLSPRLCYPQCGAGAQDWQPGRHAWQEERVCAGSLQSFPEVRDHFSDLDTDNPMQTLLLIVFEPADAAQSYDLAFSTQYCLSIAEPPATPM